MSSPVKMSSPGKARVKNSRVVSKVPVIRKKLPVKLTGFPCPRGTGNLHQVTAAVA
jgi:hypothetical protein